MERLEGLLHRCNKIISDQKVHPRELHLTLQCNEEEAEELIALEFRAMLGVSQLTLMTPERTYNG
jgi:hypothetical protein